MLYVEHYVDIASFIYIGAPTSWLIDDREWLSALDMKTPINHTRYVVVQFVLSNTIFSANRFVNDTIIISFMKSVDTFRTAQSWLTSVMQHSFLLHNWNYCITYKFVLSDL